MEAINKDYSKAFKIYQTSCDEYLNGHSCQSAGSYYFSGRATERDVVNIIWFLFHFDNDYTHKSSMFHVQD